MDVRDIPVPENVIAPEVKHALRQRTVSDDAHRAEVEPHPQDPQDRSSWTRSPRWRTSPSAAQLIRWLIMRPALRHVT